LILRTLFGKGEFQITNLSPRILLRPLKLGLKNWLFIGNAEAGPASELLCTLVANSPEQKIGPERYFEEALRRMPVNATVEEAAELTPAKLASLIRELQPRPAYREKRSKVAAQKAAA